MTEAPTRKVQLIKLSSLGFGNLFKVLFFAGLFMWIVFAIIWIVFAFVAPEALTINGSKPENLTDALLGVPLVLLIGTIFTIIGSAFGAGLLRIFGFFISITIINEQ